MGQSCGTWDQESRRKTLDSFSSRKALDCKVSNTAEKNDAKVLNLRFLTIFLFPSGSRSGTRKPTEEEIEEVENDYIEHYRKLGQGKMQVLVSCCSDIQLTGNVQRSSFQLLTRRGFYLAM
jgi:hypothetical protein